MLARHNSISKSKIKSSPWISSLLSKRLSNFMSLILKFHNRYYHNPDLCLFPYQVLFPRSCRWSRHIYVSDISCFYFCDIVCNGPSTPSHSYFFFCYTFCYVGIFDDGFLSDLILPKEDHTRILYRNKKPD